MNEDKIGSQMNHKNNQSIQINHREKTQMIQRNTKKKENSKIGESQTSDRMPENEEKRRCPGPRRRGLPWRTRAPKALFTKNPITNQEIMN